MPVQASAAGGKAAGKLGDPWAGLGGGDGVVLEEDVARVLVALKPRLGELEADAMATILVVAVEMAAKQHAVAGDCA